MVQDSRKRNSLTVAADNAYAQRIEARVLALLTANPNLSLLDLVRRCQGAYPSSVLEVLAQRGYPVTPEHECTTALVWTPELSPVRSEWYFTRRTADKLLRLADYNALAVGTPTVAEAASGAKNTRLVLIDHSPWISGRFGLENVTWLKGDFNIVLPEGNYQNVLLDPPWYFPILGAWLAKALLLVSTGGRVLMPLLSKLTRPSATADRKALIGLARRYGAVRVVPGIVEYETPLYEREALRAAGVPLACPCPWRVADLLIVKKSSANPHDSPFLANPDRSLGWREFVVNGQIISVRDASTSCGVASSDGRQLLIPVPGVTNWILDSVSARDPRRERVEVWTSRNRVARVTDYPTLLQQLHDLEIASRNSHQSMPLRGPSIHSQEILEWIRT